MLLFNTCTLDLYLLDLFILLGIGNRIGAKGCEALAGAICDFKSRKKGFENCRKTTFWCYFSLRTCLPKDITKIVVSKLKRLILIDERLSRV
jgi:hypothetical protein